MAVTAYNNDIRVLVSLAVNEYKKDNADDNAADNCKCTNSPIIGSGKINISGTVFLDDNENGIQDGEEYGLPQQKLLILPDSVYTYTDNSGKYSFWCGTESIYHIIPLLFDNWVLTTETTFSGSNSVSEVSTGKTNVTYWYRYWSLLSPRKPRFGPFYSAT